MNHPTSTVPPCEQPTEGHATEVRRSVRESGVYLLAKIVPLIFNLIFIRFYTTWFSPETVGRYETLLAIAAVAASLGVGWIQMSLLRFYPEWRTRGGRFLGTILATGFGISVGLVTLVFLVGWMGRHTPLGTELGLGLLGEAFAIFLATSSFMVASSLLRAERAATAFAAVSASTSFLNTTLCWLCALVGGATLFSLVLGTGLSLFLPALASLWVWGSLRRSPDSARGVTGFPSRAVFLSLLAFGFPLALNQAASQLLNLSDRYVILVVRGEAEAGLYSAAYRLADFAVRSVLLALMMSAYTAVTERYEKAGKQAAEELVSSLSRLYLLAVAPMVAGLAWVQTDLFGFLAGPEFQEGAALLGWIALGDLFLGLSQYQHFGLHLGKKTGRLALMTLAAALLNLILNLLLIPRFGYPAAAYTTVVSFAFLALVAPVLGKPWLIWRLPARFAIRLVVALLAMSGVVWGIGVWVENPAIRLAAQVLAGAWVYGAVLWWLGELPLARLRQLFDRS